MAFGATILDAEGLRLTAEEKALFRDTRPFGFILFARNIESADQVRGICDDFREAAGHDCLITIDQEGGRVQRIWAPMVRNWKPPLDHVRIAGAGALPAMYLRARLIADELRSLGINSNCAPVVDIATEGTHPFLKNRCYGETLDDVVALARATAKGHLDTGVLPVMKHMPGHGRSTLDTHHDLPRVKASAEDLRATDFAAFQGLRNLPMAMTAHLVFEAFDDLPATQSPTMMNLIRSEIGYDGLVMTDDLSMNALSGTAADRTRAALDAGVDVALYCNASLADRIAVAEAAEELSEAGQRRALAALNRLQEALPLDIKAAEEELNALMGGEVYD